jgi:ankyrin repeat protein
LTIDELEEALSFFPNQTAWQSPSYKLDISRLAKLCANLVNYNETNRTVSLAHHTVESFLLGCSGRQEVSSYAIEEIATEQYLADMCLTYLSFTDFHQALSRTCDTTSLSTMDRPIRLLENMTPGFIRPWVLHAARGRRSRSANQPVDVVNVLRTELSAHQSKKMDPTFQLLEYCKSYWCIHTRYIALQDTERLAKVENFVRGTHLPKEWMPWSSIKDKGSLRFWNMFLWAVRNGHTVIFCIWQKIAEVPESRFWKCLWQDEGNKLFASACASANLTQLEMMLSARRTEHGILRPSKSQLSHELVSVSHLGHYEAVERLLQEKADVNAAAAQDGGRTALQAAAEGGHLAVVERLLQEKADVNAAAAQDGGRTALQAAADGGHLAVVERLLQEKADVNAAAAQDGGRTALQAAADGGHLAVVERLLQEKADVNAAAAQDSGRTALQAAAEGGHLAVVERLLQEKANVNAAAGHRGKTALQAAAEGGHLAVVERLLQEKANVNAAAADLSGKTALQAAAEGGHLAVVERLLQEKADVNAAATDYGGRTALQAAAEGGHLAVVERLLQEKADVNAAAAQDGGRTALQAAVEGGYARIVDSLHAAGARQ